MPLTMSHSLPGSDIRLGNIDDDKNCILGILDICAEMNNGKVLVYQYIITPHPHLVETYEQFNEHGIFEPI